MFFHHTFGLCAHTQPVVQRRDSRYLLLVAVGDRQPLVQFCFARRVGFRKGGQEQEGLLIASYIAADGFAESLGVTVDVQYIILDLERQTDMQTVLIERFLLCGIRSGDITAYLQRVRQQH